MSLHTLPPQLLVCVLAGQLGRKGGYWKSIELVLKQQQPAGLVLAVPSRRTGWCGRVKAAIWIWNWQYQATTSRVWSTQIFVGRRSSLHVSLQCSCIHALLPQAAALLPKANRKGKAVVLEDPELTVLFPFFSEATTEHWWEANACRPPETAARTIPERFRQKKVRLFPFHWRLPPAVMVARDENRRKRTEKSHFYFRFYIFWRKRDRVPKIRVRKRDRITRKYGNELIRTLSRKE